MSKDFGAPPVFFMSFFTQDRGKTWKLVPLPSGAALERSGGFRAEAQYVEALFNGEASGADQFPPPIVEQTRDGGATWTPAGLACPAVQGGPCVRWGPVPGQIWGWVLPPPRSSWLHWTEGRPGSPGLRLSCACTGRTSWRLLRGWGFPGCPDSQAGRISRCRSTRDGGKSWQAHPCPRFLEALRQEPRSPGCGPAGWQPAGPPRWRRTLGCPPGAPRAGARSRPLVCLTVAGTLPGNRRPGVVAAAGRGGSRERRAPASLPLSSLKCGGRAEDYTPWASYDGPIPLPEPPFPKT